MQAFLVDSRIRVITSDIAYFAVRGLYLSYLGVAGYVENYWAGTSAARYEECAGHGVVYIFGMAHLQAPFGYGLGDAYHVCFLEGVRPEVLRPDLPGDNHKRGRIHHSVAKAGDYIGCAGSGSDYDHAHASCGAGIPLGGMYGALLVANEYVAERVGIVVQRVVDRQNLPSGITEHRVDALGYYSSQEGVGSANRVFGGYFC